MKYYVSLGFRMVKGSCGGVLRVSPAKYPHIHGLPCQVPKSQDYLRLIDTDTSGPRCDVTPLFMDRDALQALVDDLAHPFDSTKFDYVAGIDALGFILGTALAIHLNKGFIAIRKGGKLPVPVASLQFTDYTGQEKTLELRKDILKPNSRVLLVDEWIETGAQANAALELLEGQRAEIIGIATINIDENPSTQKIRDRYFCHAIWLDGDDAV